MKYLEVEVEFEGAPEQAEAERQAIGNRASDERRRKRRDQVERQRWSERRD